MGLERVPDLLPSFPSPSPIRSIMKLKEFIDKCVSEGYGWKEADHNNTKGYFVGSKRLDTVSHFTKQAIEDNDWAMLNRQIIQGKDVYHISRVVGYYSNIQNWNKSKVGELQDRHAGNYKI